MHMDKFQDHLASANVIADGFKNETYLDFAEKILMNLLDMGIQKENGIISDSLDNRGMTFRGKALELFHYNAEARFCGALGQLIRAGRMAGYADRLYLSYEHLMNIIAYDFEPDLFTEFWVKELVFAYQGLEAINYPKINRDIWEKVTWRKYGFHYFENYTNGIAYAISSEACKISAGLGGDDNFFDAWAPVLFDKFNKKYGMYTEPGSPMTYDLVTKQQMLYAIRHGADGRHKEKALVLIETGAVSSLFMQSVTGQMPYGGRVNQFLSVDTMLACFFEMMSSVKIENLETKSAGVFKRAARNAVRSIEPWLNMEPYRHLRQGFKPELGHGIDCGGVYTAYSLLTSSILGSTYFESLRNTDTECIETPAESSGYIFVTDDDFHKVFAACGGYHLEVDTCADPTKDATGLGRLHKAGIMPETALSGPCAPEPTYSYALSEIEPIACAIGPAWLDNNNEIVSLAEVDRDMIKSRITIMNEESDSVAFSISYEMGDSVLEETYQLNKDGLLYNVKGKLPGLHIIVPLLKTDGMEKGIVSITEDGVLLDYRGAEFRVICERPELTGRLCANRNGIYEIVRIEDRMVRFSLN